MSCTVILNKICGKCGEGKPFDQFYKNPTRKDGLRPWCKRCCNKDNQEREPRYKKYRGQYRQSERGGESQRKRSKKYRGTVRGHLRQVYSDIKCRCDNPSCGSYVNYGGRGIQNRFGSSDEFVDYVVNELQIDPQGLQIDRINNDGHYEKGNIRFVTAKKNLNNRRNTKH